MTLSAFRDLHSLSLRQLADLLGIEGAFATRTVQRYVTHQRIPDRRTMRAIEERTGGVVRSSDFPDVPERIAREPVDQDAA